MSILATQRRSLIVSHTLYDFLAPSLVQTIRTSRVRQCRRCLSSTSNAPAAVASDASPNSSKPKKPLSAIQREFLNRALRVNQAGELAATLIYATQTPPIVNSHPHLRPLMKHMYDQEAGHFGTFNELLAKHRVRPTAMYPVWTFAASTLGWGTAIMGREAAMACTEAVETAIGGHYDEQVRELVNMVDEMERQGEEVGEELRELTGTIRRIRDEELEHLDHAVDNDAKEAKPYELLTGVIKAGCKSAIWISERV
ncbi:ubiquinone biosynthesis protein COQ7-domain-containing protein [Calycina marina]|uniref:5-demethoxyubiquinone hydroxylase, mitochondrial n=1 Tax=Calycina marina TaxID=1763456 RepID=A0A9P8CFL2_9HELO|nr:ubiquinone biosynthesis protein COQ7-domain-containing protein [Calycina marina]